MPDPPKTGKEVPLEVQKQFYRPVCNEKEIERIFNIRNANDYLLKLRADTIVDNMRLFRVYRNKALINEKQWSMEGSFATSHYDGFLKSLDLEAKTVCSKVITGNIFSTESNGQIFSTDYGPIITICDSLTFFIKFMNLGIMDFGNRVPEHVRINSIRIALRVMLQTEALDFFMDPRGIVPQDIGEAIISTVPFQMQFIAGHEYAHYVLGHLDDNNLKETPVLKALLPGQQNYGMQMVYNNSQKNEFEADLNSILLCNYDKEVKTKIFENSLVWFACLEVFEAVQDVVSPSVGFETHPKPMERMENLLHGIPMPTGYNYKKWKRLKETISSAKKFFIDDISTNFELYEMYGSVYLDKPDSKWRGKQLVDRVDYY